MPTASTFYFYKTNKKSPETPIFRRFPVIVFVYRIIDSIYIFSVRRMLRFIY